MIQILSIVVRSVLSLLVLFLLTKLMGRKQVQQLTLFDYIIGISIGSIAAEMVLNEDVYWLHGVTAIGVYALTAVFISWITAKKLSLRRVITGVPILLLQKGDLLIENFKKTKIDLNEFLSECRSNGYFDLSQLDYVLIEANGKMSFLPASQYAPLTPADMGKHPSPSKLSANVILDGQVMERHLRMIGKDKTWLQTQLEQQGIKRPEEVFLAITTGDQLTVYRKDKIKPPKNLLE